VTNVLPVLVHWTECKIRPSPRVVDVIKVRWSIKLWDVAGPCVRRARRNPSVRSARDVVAFNSLFIHIKVVGLIPQYLLVAV